MRDKWPVVHPVSLIGRSGNVGVVCGAVGIMGETVKTDRMANMDNMDKVDEIDRASKAGLDCVQRPTQTRSFQFKEYSVWRQKLSA